MSLSLLRSVDKIALEPVIALIGPEAFVRQKVRERLAERALGSAMKEMNFSRFQAGEDDLTKAWDACRDFPCFAEKRVVLISSLAKMKKKESEAFINYVKKPSATTTLVLDDEKLDGRLDWVKALKKNAQWIDVPEATPAEAGEWTRILLKREGKQGDGELGARLIEYLGTSLGTLQIAVQQLATYVGEKLVIETADLENLFVKLSEENIFAVVESLFSGRPQELHAKLGRMLEMGEAPLKILALIFRHLSILLSLQDADAREVSSIFRISPYFLRQYEAQGAKLRRHLNPGLLAPLTQADFSLKSSSLDDAVILKRCVEELRAKLH